MRTRTWKDALEQKTGDAFVDGTVAFGYRIMHGDLSDERMRFMTDLEDPRRYDAAVCWEWEGEDHHLYLLVRVKTKRWKRQVHEAHRDEDPCAGCYSSLFFIYGLEHLLCIGDEDALAWVAEGEADTDSDQPSRFLGKEEAS